MWTRAARALWGLLLLTALDLSGCLEVTVRPDKHSRVMVSTELPPDLCAVCKISGVNDTEVSCSGALDLLPEVEVKLLLNCTQPVESAYSVSLSHRLECSTDACRPSTVEAQMSILTELSRTFTWDVTAPEKTAVYLDVLGEGLVRASQPCSDGIQFALVDSQRGSQQPTQYCRGGSQTRLELTNQDVVVLQAAPKAQDTVVFQASAGPLKGKTFVVSIDSGTTVVLNPQGLKCEICTATGSTPDCSSGEKTLTNVANLSVEFGCKTPQDVFSVSMSKKIECTQSSCTPAAAEVDPDLFKDFERSLRWDVGVPDRTELSLDFPGDGLKEISAGESCEDGFLYSVSTTKNDGRIKTSSYCRGGMVSHLDLLRATTVTVDAPKGGDVEKTVFSIRAAPRASRMMSVTPDPDTIITISRQSAEPDCSVCVGQPPNQKCNDRYLQLRDPRNTSVEFTCPQPQDLFTVEINREIDCTETSCSGDIVQAETSLFPDFNRTFSWDLKVVSTHAFQLDFPEPGMRQIPNGETCPDEHTYSFLVYLRSGPVGVGTFCKGGLVTSILARYKGRVSLEVPGYAKLNPVNFKLKVGPETDKVAIVKVNLPRGVSENEFISPNYPGDFPDLQKMQWDFTVPDMHNYSVRFLDHSEPECLDGDVTVEYQRDDKKPTTLSLTDAQPEHQQGSFSMLLSNCETNRTLQGLALKYRVSVMRSGHPVLCTVDLTKHKGVSVQLEKVGSDPYCEMSIDSQVQEKIDVAAGSSAKLSFLDCPVEDVRLTASQLIECQNVASCPASVLSIPTLDSCLRTPLRNFTWNIRIPQSGTVDLVSPAGTLKQSLPALKCRQAVTLHVAEGDGFPVGDFCSNGTLQKVQVHANVSVTATARDFSKAKGPFLNVSVSREIKETIIYRVSPTLTSPTLLATPNWPKGTKPSSTVSWIVAVPSGYKAHLHFINVSQPKCQNQHTAINVKMLENEEEMMSRNENEQVEDLLVPNSFYLNMSNCIPEKGDFGAVTKITLEKTSNLLAIALGIAGALLLSLIVLGLVCFFTKKKQRDKKNKEASIYMGKGSIFRPGDRHFSKSRSDNESHVYDSIDDTMVYGHLLPDSSYADSLSDHYKGSQPDSYRTFTGTANNALPIINEPDPEPEMDGFSTFLSPSDSFMPPRPRTPISRQDSLGFQDSRMVDNELYTFKSTGDINTIRLSAADLEPQPPVTEDSL
ncbi:CUB domain-containing protein 1 [Salarias fasciatus]|uniref:CUB domain-containing protein 1-like n=1 Tax=Salarias fasciatus TaxID=181472 RepID=A0A672GE80_SALFA|nr:CUB domain-containing protein 1-like [Salarias fasciatus]